ncbi:MAG TPA: acetyl-CoA C-acetyltransferase [Thermoleophilia bacterium]|nr:acetyl-CoA C-acetyltransferase [Thermoleophilia bacterium]
MSVSSVILGGARTPFGRSGGALASLTAPELGAVVIRVALRTSRVADGDVDHAVMGLVLGAGVGQVPSRQATLLAGLPVGLTSETVNKVCASGLRAVSMADQMIRCGDVDVVVAGGMESMSNAPYLLERARFGYRMGDGELVDAMVRDGLIDPIVHVHMGVHNADVSEELHITREEQDAWALRSHRRAVAAIDAGRLVEEIEPVSVRVRKGETIVVATDEAPRRDTSMEALAALRPAFREGGTTTAGNAPGVNDGAGALVVARSGWARERGLAPWAAIRGWATVADEPRYLAKVPAQAALKALAAAGLDAVDVDLWEINEAFASVAVNSVRTLGIDSERVNVNGGAVAFGHPIGASGARILLTLVLELRRRGGGIGVAAICSGIAQGDAVVVEV